MICPKNSVSFEPYPVLKFAIELEDCSSSCCVCPSGLLACLFLTAEGKIVNADSNPMRRDARRHWS